MISETVSRARAYRLYKGWSVFKLAEQAGLSRGALRDMEKPDWCPRADTLKALETLIPESFRFDRGLVQPSGKWFPSEDDFHKSVKELFDLIMAPEVVYFHIPNGGLRNKAVAAKLKVMGVLAGVYDWFIGWNNGVAWLEMKSRNGRLSDDQIVFRDRVASLGHDTGEARTIEEVMELLDKWGVPHKKVAQVA